MGVFLNKIISVLFKTKEMSRQTIDVTKHAMEYGKAVRRIILLFISLVWLWTIQVAVKMYVTTSTLDGNYTNLCIAVTTMVGACYAFYFNGRSTEQTTQQTNNVTE
jgi:uncharacterized membrane protein